MKKLALFLLLLFPAGLLAQFVQYGPGGSETVTSSATPTFSTYTNASYMVLTANVTTFTLGNGLLDSQLKTICWKQGSGAYTVAPPANVHGFFTIGLTSGKYNCQDLIYSATNAIWLSRGPGTVNQ